MYNHKYTFFFFYQNPNIFSLALCSISFSVIPTFIAVYNIKLFFFLLLKFVYLLLPLLGTILYVNTLTSQYSCPLVQSSLHNQTKSQSPFHPTVSLFGSTEMSTNYTYGILDRKKIKSTPFIGKGLLQIIHLLKKKLLSLETKLLQNHSSNFPPTHALAQLTTISNMKGWVGLEGILAKFP